MVNLSVQWMQNSSVNRAYISLGSNLGDRESNITECAELLSRKLTLVVQSPLYETPPWGFDSNQSFLNGVIAVDTDLNPWQLLQFLLDTENALGRIRKNDGKYHDRIIDLDILIYDTLVLDDGNLIIPHPRLHLRNFVLWPLNDIEPNLVHPVLNQTIQELKSQSRDQSIPASFKSI